MSVTNLFDDAMGPDDFLTREWNQDSRAFTGPKEEDFTASQAVLDAINGCSIPTDAELGLTEADLPAVGVTLDTPIMLSDMKGVAKDDPKWDEFVSQLTLDEMALLSGNGAWHIEGLERLGVPFTRTPDGSVCVGASTYSGAIMGTDAAGITYPCPVVTASSWNEDIAYMMGTSAGSEAPGQRLCRLVRPPLWIPTALPSMAATLSTTPRTASWPGTIASNVVRGRHRQGRHLLCQALRPQ